MLQTPRRRDFFIFTALKAGGDLLRPEGIQGKPVEWRAVEGDAERWAGGATGLPFVDACMRELAATGFVSNRGRQNAAGLFCKVGSRVSGARVRAPERGWY